MVGVGWGGSVTVGGDVSVGAIEVGEAMGGGVGAVSSDITP